MIGPPTLDAARTPEPGSPGPDIPVSERDRARLYLDLWENHLARAAMRWPDRANRMRDG